MAKKTTKKEQEQDIVITVNESNTNDEVVKEEAEITEEAVIKEDLSNKEDETIITLVDVTNKPVEPKKVKIRMKQDHKCFIGGQWYYLQKGCTYNVPEVVKQTLAEAGLLLPL